MFWCSYQTLTLPEDEAANCIYVNNHLIHRCFWCTPYFSVVSRHESPLLNCLGRRMKISDYMLKPPQPFHRDSSLRAAAAGENRVCHQRDFSVGIPEDRAGPLFALHPGEEEQDHQKDITIHPFTNCVDLVRGKPNKTTSQSLLGVIISYILSFT